MLLVNWVRKLSAHIITNDSKSRYWYRKKFDITLYIYFHDL